MTPADLLCKNATDLRLIYLPATCVLYFFLVYSIRDPEYFATPGQITSACFMCVAILCEFIAGWPMIFLYAKGLRTLSFEEKNDRLDLVLSAAAPMCGVVCINVLALSTDYRWTCIGLYSILYSIQMNNTIIIWLRSNKTFNKTLKKE
jgi:hypothetical protein